MNSDLMDSMVTDALCDRGQEKGAILRSRSLRSGRNFEIDRALTQEPIIRLRLEHLLRPVKQEAERQEYLHVWTLLQDSLIDLPGVL